MISGNAADFNRATSGLLGSIIAERRDGRGCAFCWVAIFQEIARNANSTCGQYCS